MIVLSDESVPTEEQGVAVVGAPPGREPVRTRGRKRGRARVRGEQAVVPSASPTSVSGARTPRHARRRAVPDGAVPDGAVPDDGLPDHAALEDAVPDDADGGHLGMDADVDPAAAQDDATAETATTGARAGWTPPTRGRGAYRPGTVSTRLAIGLGALALVASVLAVVFGVLWSSASSDNAQASQAKQVATAFLLKFTNFKPSTINADFQALQSFATGAFAKQASHNFGNAGLRQELVQAQVQSQGTIQHIYVESLAGNHAQVYAVVNQAYTNAQLTQSGSPRLHDVLRLQIDLATVSGNWKISNVLVLSGPSSATPTAGK